MAEDNPLQELLVDELKDLYSAENQIIRALPKMIKAATAPELKRGFEKHLEELYHLETINNGRPINETRAQVSRLPDFFRYNAGLALARRDSVIPVQGPYLNYTIRTPLGVFSKHSISPNSSRTTMPAARKAAATAYDTSSSSVDRMRGPAWKSWTREPKALKIEATCAPVAPAPMTSIDGGTEVRAQASLWVEVSSNPGMGSRRLVPPVQIMIFSA